MDIQPQDTYSGKVTTGLDATPDSTSLRVRIYTDLPDHAIAIEGLIEQSVDGKEWFTVGGFADPDIRNCLYDKEGNYTGYIEATYTEQIVRYDKVKEDWSVKRVIPTDTAETYHQLSFMPLIRVTIDTFTEGKERVDAELNYKTEISFGDVVPSPLQLAQGRT